MDQDSIGCAKLVVFCNAPDDNPFMAGAFHGVGETDAVIGRLRESAATAERRADAIIDATARREVTARETTRKKTADLPADKLCDALSAMLADYRADY